MEEDEIFENSMTDSPTPEEDKPRDLTSKKETRNQLFGSFDHLRFEPLRFFMNPAMNPSMNTGLSPFLNQAAMLNLQQQLVRQLPTPPVPPSGAPKRSKLLIDEILNLTKETTPDSSETTKAETSTNTNETGRSEGVEPEKTGRIDGITKDGNSPNATTSA
ncbi:hypothetical protein AB6A40_010011 [Gnathostoma spinigerum]|uniref:Uncharacterized protein n=1 Tax=Gnathostoma spinigerum TaxID=75299 RepID=A0ABD6F1X7_9BILA